jgi:CubicO group peptidase (beta-lactamase class C family)
MRIGYLPINLEKESTLSLRKLIDLSRSSWFNRRGVKHMRHRIIGCGLIFAILALVLGGCSAAPATNGDQATYWPAHDWRTSTPEEQGLDSTSILALLQEIQNKNLPIHSLLIIRHGYLVTEAYFPPYQREFKHPVFSMTKSVTSALVGKALQEGHLKDVQQKVLDFFADIAPQVSDPQVKNLTLAQLLTMSAGFNTNTLPDLSSKFAADGTIEHILTYDSILAKPGTSFYYDSGLPHLLSAIIQRTTGQTLREYAQQKLFDPLGISDVSWAADPQGVTLGNTGLMLRSPDLAKLGYLYLQHGRWNGTQVLPEEWVTASTRKQMETKGLMNAAEDDGYGYLWWIDSWGGYSAHGFGGQYIFVLPAQDMVVVFTSGLSDAVFPAPNQLVKSYLLPAVRSDVAIAANPAGVQALESALQAIAQPDRSLAPLPDIAHRISGQTFHITEASPPNAWPETIAYTFNGGNIYQAEEHWPGGQSIVVEGSLSKVFKYTPLTFEGYQPSEDIIVALRGHWQDDHTFIEEYIRDMNSEIELITQKSTFEGNHIALELTSSMQPFTLHAVGEMIP